MDIGKAHMRQQIGSSLFHETAWKYLPNVSHFVMGSLLQTWFNFNPSMDK